MGNNSAFWIWVLVVGGIVYWVTGGTFQPNTRSGPGTSNPQYTGMPMPTRTLGDVASQLFGGGGGSRYGGGYDGDRGYGGGGYGYGR